METYAVEVQQPDLAPVETEFNAIAGHYATLVLTTADQVEEAADMLRVISRKIKELEAQRQAITRPLDQAKKQAMDLFRGPISLAEKAEKAIKDALLAFNQRRAKEEEERRRKAQEEAERDRQRLLAESQAAAQQGDVEAAADLQKQVEAVKPAIVLPAAVVETPGVQTRKVWDFEVTDKLALIQWVAEHPEFALLLDVNSTAVRSLIMPSVKEGNQPPAGIRVFEKEQVAVRG